MAQKKPLTTNIVARKEFGFSKDGVNLVFTLRTDVKIEMLAFLEMMEAAKKAIEVEYVKLENDK